jgi:hypothetical protein
MIDWFSFLMGAATLKLCQVIYRIGREHGAVSDSVDKRNAEYLHTVIRQAPRDPKADISRAVGRDTWRN